MGDRVSVERLIGFESIDHAFLLILVSSFSHTYEVLDSLTQYFIEGPNSARKAISEPILSMLDQADPAVVAVFYHFCRSPEYCHFLAVLTHPGGQGIDQVFLQRIPWNSGAMRSDFDSSPPSRDSVWQRRILLSRTLRRFLPGADGRFHLRTRCVTSCLSRKSPSDLCYFVFITHLSDPSATPYMMGSALFTLLLRVVKGECQSRKMVGRGEDINCHGRKSMVRSARVVKWCSR
jgi:hypothetical protein